MIQIETDITDMEDVDENDINWLEPLSEMANALTGLPGGPDVHAVPVVKVPVFPPMVSVTLVPEFAVNFHQLVRPDVIGVKLLVAGFKDTTKAFTAFCCAV